MAGTRRSAQAAPDSGVPRWSRALRALREAAGVTRDGWATLLGYGRTTVQRWETGETAPDANAETAIVALCRERALFRRYELGPLAGESVTPAWLGDLLAQARLHGRGQSPDAGGGGGELPSAPGPRFSNLPHPLTSFVGRKHERAEVVRLLAGTRLLTLTGTGGAGKTRLALESARAMLGGSDAAGAGFDGVWWVELAAVADGTVVGSTVAVALGVREEAGRAVEETLVQFVGARRVLLVLDNCEHLIDGCARLAGALLRACPDLTLLATSRRRLGITGETVFRVPPLAVDSAPETAPAELRDTRSPALDVHHIGDAVRLLAERARAARPSFELDGANLKCAVRVCRRLDGMPLAIELAAARLDVLSLEQIAERLDDRFRLLTTGSRIDAPRHQTLRALVDWSYDLLEQAERRLFARLSVFAGGFDLGAVEAVCADQETCPDALDGLARLADASLVIADESDSEARYRLLETLRQYAAERLAGAGEAETIAARHRDHYLALAEDAEPALRGPDQARWLNRLAADLDNLRAALAYCERDPDGAEKGLRLARALWRFWQVRGLYVEGRGWLARALAHEGDAPPLVRARALNSAGVLASGQGEYREAARLYQESLLLARAAGDPITIAAALNNLGLAHTNLGSDDTARAFHEEGLALRREMDDRWGMSVALLNLGFLAQRRGEYARAWHLYEESLAIKRELDDAEGMAACIENLGDVALATGNLAEARAHFEESLALRRQLSGGRGIAAALRGLGDVACRHGEHMAAVPLYAESLEIARRLGVQRYIAECLEGFADVAVAQGRPEESAQLLAASDALRTAINAPPPPDRQALLGRLATDTRRVMGDADFAGAWEAGRAMATEDAIARALRLAL